MVAEIAARAIQRIGSLWIAFAEDPLARGAVRIDVAGGEDGDQRLYLALDLAFYLALDLAFYLALRLAQWLRGDV